MTRTACRQDVREIAAVLVALAGLRRGQAFAAEGAGSLVEAALAAAAGRGATGAAHVAVAGGADHVAAAAARLVPGGRLVAVATDREAARRAAEAAEAVLLQVVALPHGVAWRAQRGA